VTKPKILSPLELEIMEVIWDLGECSSAEVIAAFRKRRPLAETSIRTVLTKILGKGYIVKVPSIERGFRYKPAIARDVVAARSFRALLRNFFEGSPSRAIAHLIREETIDDEELDRLRRLLSARKKRK
jgi:predicted transcriptional regulator